MLQTQAVWLLIILAVTTAGLPFYTRHPLIFWPWTAQLPFKFTWQRSLASLNHLLLLYVWTWVTQAWIGNSLASSALAVFFRVVLMLVALAVLLIWPAYVIQGQPTDVQPAKVKSGSKPFISRLLEWLALYALTLTLGFALETQLGNPFPQRWEFYAITLSLYLVPAFPAFVWRYLLRR